MTKLGQLLLAATALALGASASADADDDGSLPPSPLAVERERLNNESLLWGPYKPNLYFATRPRVPDSLWTGLMWGGLETYSQVPESEYTMRSMRSRGR